MADQKISALAALTGANAATGDLVPVVDVSDTTMAASGTNKSMTLAEVIAALKLLGELPEVVYKTADQSSSDNVNLADVTDLLFPIVATGIYVVEFYLFVVSAATTTGLVVALNGPASPDHVRYGFSSPTSGTALFTAGATAYETALVSTGVKSTTEPTCHKIWGFVDNGANAGDLKLRMRSEVSGSNATIQRGSWGRLVKVG